MNYLSVEQVSKRYGERLLFEGISFGLDLGQKTALIAKNGTGKTSLLRILASLESPDTGSVTFRKGIRVGYLDQDPEFAQGQTVLNAIFESESPVLQAIRNYEKALEHAEDVEALQACADEMERLNAWDYEAQVKQILFRLNIQQLDQPIHLLSGGQRKRVALARLLIDRPELLILDEPTNHLDLEMIEWLEQFLSSDKVTLLMVTHDRYFLERVCSEIVELDAGQLFRYKGNYSYFLEKKAERQATQHSEVEKARNLFRKELEWMRRMPKARGTKAKARVDAFGDLKEKASQKLQARQMSMEVKSTRLGTKVLEFHHLSKSFGDLKVLDNFSYKFIRGEKVGIVGRNGTGKSTLLNMIAEGMEPDSGKVVVGETVVFGHYRQDGISFSNDMRVIEAVKEIAEVIPLTKGRKLTASQMLERFLFPPSTHYNYIAKLSGGEKRRLYLLTVLMKNPNFLLLDEPTNDLDILTLNVLEEFLQEYAGCVMIVTHDRYFMDKVIDHLFVFEGEGKVKDFPGQYSQYREWAKARKTEEESQQKKVVSPKETAPKADKPKVKLSYMEKREFDQLEKDIADLEKRKQEITEAMTAGNLSGDELNELSIEFANLEKTLSEKEDRWLELSEWA